jgi:DNA polymerase
MPSPTSPPSAEDAARELAAVTERARGCRNCELWEHATQTVFGAGPVTAGLLLVGEQPGDVEDRQGLPFVGPAGTLLRKAVRDAGIDPDDVYRTNAVKHFRFRSSGPGKRRIHQKPDLSHLVACAPWLTAELSLVQARVLVVLGATAARALLGPAFRVTASRGTPLPWTEVAYRDLTDVPTTLEQVVATIHPSAVLRSDDRDGAYAGLVDDLRVAAGCLAELAR